MEYDLKIGPQGHVYIPKKIREVFGDKLKLLPNNSAGVIYAENGNPVDVIASLRVLILHLELRVNKEAQQE